MKKLSKNPRIKTLGYVIMVLVTALSLAGEHLGQGPYLGIVGRLIGSTLDSLIGIPSWLIVFWLSAIACFRLSDKYNKDLSPPLMVLLILSFSGLTNEGLIGEYISSAFTSLFGDLFSKITLVTISLYLLIRLLGLDINKFLPNKLLKKKGTKPKKESIIEAKKESPVEKNIPSKTEEISQSEKPKSESSEQKNFHLPSLESLDLPAPENQLNKRDLEAIAKELVNSLNSFDIRAKIEKWVPGPMATTFYVQLSAGTKSSKITALNNDIGRSIGLSENAIRFSGNIVGEKNTIGIEVPNSERSFCKIRELLEQRPFMESKAKLPLALGISINGDHIVDDLTRFPHLMVAGSTGSGKSVALNGMLFSLLFKKLPSELELMLIDPKAVEFSPYKGIPHLRREVIIDMDESIEALDEVCELMDKRYGQLEAAQVRNIEEYNNLIDSNGKLDFMKYSVVVIDELADLMMVYGKRVEDLVGRLSQKARAAGIHLILATQRPTSDVIKGLIKTNVPARIAFRVSSNVDSRVIINQKGAESMLGKGDCLFSSPQRSNLIRMQSPEVSLEEIERVVNSINKK